MSVSAYPYDPRARASRLVELLVRLQLRGGASATELAAALGVSVRTVYRDVEALSAAGVPIYTEVGRNGGIRIDPAYSIAGLPRLDAAEARGVLFAVVPAIAEQLGLDAAAVDRTLFPAMERSTETATRVVRDRLLVEPTTGSCRRTKHRHRPRSHRRCGSLARSDLTTEAPVSSSTRSA